MFLAEFLLMGRRAVANSIEERMAHEMYGIAVFGFVKVFFKGQDDVHLIDVAADVFDPVFFPGPNLW